MAISFHKFPLEIVGIVDIDGDELGFKDGEELGINTVEGLEEELGT